MKKLILRLLVVILSVYVAGSVCPLFATQQPAPTTAPAPPPPPGPSGAPPLDTKMGGIQGGPPTVVGGGCGGGGPSLTAPPPPTTPPAGEIASTDKGPVILPPDDSPYKGPPLPPPPGSEDKKKDGDKKNRKQEALDGMTSELAASLKGDGGDVSDATLTQQVNRIEMLLSLNPNLKLPPEFIKDLNQYDKNLKNQRAADRQEYEIYHNAVVKFDNLAKDARKQAVTDITGAMVGELSKLNVGYGPLGIPFTAAEQMRRTRNAEVIANDFKNITNAVEARKKASYLRESMSLRVKSIDKRLKILQPLMK